MSSESTRRNFLKMSAIALAGTATASANGDAATNMTSAPPSGKLEVWVTSQSVRCTKTKAIEWQTRSAGLTGSLIALDPAKQFQTVLGFGAALTDASCYMLNQLSPSAREKLLHEMFHQSEMALNVCRICMGASDYSASVYSYDEGEPDPDLERFSIEHDRAYILPVLR